MVMLLCEGIMYSTSQLDVLTAHTRRWTHVTRFLKTTSTCES